MNEQFLQKPDIKISVNQTFGFDSDMRSVLLKKTVCASYNHYKFDKDTTLAIWQVLILINVF